MTDAPFQKMAKRDVNPVAAASMTGDLLVHLAVSTLPPKQPSPGPNTASEEVVRATLFVELPAGVTARQSSLVDETAIRRPLVYLAGNPLPPKPTYAGPYAPLPKVKAVLSP